ncbi:hypothetical protein MC885_021545 [Smutsia gigantea]|nr:hypothetical protein MC885_021545 [Smutsia gigantea]
MLRKTEELVPGSRAHGSISCQQPGPQEEVVRRFPGAQEQPGRRRGSPGQGAPELGFRRPPPAAQPRGGAGRRDPSRAEGLPVPGFRRRVPGPQGELQPGPQRPSDSDHGLELVALAVLRLLEAGGSESRARLPRPCRPALAARRDSRRRPTLLAVPCGAPQLPADSPQPFQVRARASGAGV